MSVVDTVVIGGGLAGLFYAYLFSQASASSEGKQLILLEKQGRLGGRIQSFVVGDSAHLELGPSRFSSEHTVLQNLLRDLSIEFKEYSSKPISTYRSPWLFQFPSGREQLLASYPTLTLEEQKVLSRYDFNGLRLLLASTSSESSPYESLESFLRRKLQSSLLATVCLESTGWNSLKDVQASEAHWIVQEMYRDSLHWFSTSQPLSEMVSRLVQKCLESKRISLRLNCEVVKVSSNSVHYRSGGDERSLACRKVIPALDLPSLQKVNLVPAVTKNLASFPVLRIYAHFSQPWIQKDFPVLYTASPLGLVIPSSVPGWMQVSYTDGADTSLWLDLLGNVPASDQKQMGAQVWSFPVREDTVIWLRLQKELQQLLPGSVVPTPSVLLMHLCQVMYPLPLSSDMKQTEDQGSISVIGEAICLHENVGITSAWMESALRTTLKEFLLQENKSASLLQKFWKKGLYPD